MKQICPLRNVVQEYAWGSKTAIAELLGEEAPTAAPQAETQAQSLEIQNRELKEKYKSANVAVGKLAKELQQCLPQVVETTSVDLGLEKGEITVTKQGTINIAGDVMFASGSANCTAKAKTILKKIAPMLKNEFKEAYIRIEGHTDNQPIKTVKDKYPTNWHLSMARAISVLIELEKLGVPNKKMYAAGYGEYKPRVPNNPKGGTKANRRVEIAIVESK